MVLPAVVDVIGTTYTCRLYKDAIKNVQRRATNQLPGMKDIPYQERFERLKLPTLAYRRTSGDMIEVYKLLQGKYDSDVSSIVKLHKGSDTREGTRFIV